MPKDRFGDIKIRPGAGDEEKPPDISIGGESREKEEPSPLPGEAPSPHLRDEGIPPSRLRQRRPSMVRKVSGRTLGWLSVLPVLVLLYLAITYFGVPWAVKSLILPKLEQRLNRPVSVDRLVFSPFTNELLAEQVTIGALPGDMRSKELMAMQSARFEFSLERIFEAKLVCSEALLKDISVHLVREADARLEMSDLADSVLTSLYGQEGALWPDWFILDEVRLTGGEIIVDDRQTGRTFAIEQIRLDIPSTEKREGQGSEKPKLQAVIDSSPFEIVGVRFRSQEGIWRTGFSFVFKQVLINNFKELLPLPDSGFKLTEGEADISLRIILPERRQGQQGFVIEGDADLKSLQWEDSGRNALLQVPRARIVYRIAPAERLTRFTNVEFYEPVLTLSPAEAYPSTSMLLPVEYFHGVLSSLSGAGVPLQVENFLWNNGRLLLSGKKGTGGNIVLDDVVFTLSGFTTQGHREAHPPEGEQSFSYEFTARDISAGPPTEFASSGTLGPAGSMNGEMEIKGVDMSRYALLMSPSQYSFARGKADISFLFQYNGPSAGGQDASGNQNRMYKGDFTVQDYELKKKDKKMLAGSRLDCSGFSVDTRKRTAVCGQFELQDSTIDAAVFQGGEAADAQKKNVWRFLIESLQVEGSTIETEMTGPAAAGSVPLVLKKVRLQADNLQAESASDNIKAEGRLGSEGKVALLGSYSFSSGHGQLQMTLQKIDLKTLQPYYEGWFVPEVTAGELSAQGSLQLPEKLFSGKVSIDDFAAGKEQTGAIGWKRLFASRCTYRHQAMAVAVDKLVLQDPVLESGLSNGADFYRKYLSLDHDSLPSTIQIPSITIENGTVTMPEPILYPGYQPVLENINGTISQSAAEQVFAFNGALGQFGRFAIKGSSTLTDLQSYELSVQNFSLAPFAAILEKETGFKAAGSVASWQQKFDSTGKTARTVTADMTLDNVVPLPDGSTAFLLALITGPDHAIRLTMDGEYAPAERRPFLLQQFVHTFKRLEIKAEISPRLVVKSFLPRLELPPEVDFPPGSAEPEVAVPLTGYQDFLRLRPFAMLRLQGHYDPAADREVLVGELQAEADRKREAENKRRALEKIRILQEQKRRQEELKKAPPSGVVVEEIPPTELSSDLDPLPPVKVELPAGQLEELAARRASALQEYLVDELELAPEQITIAAEAGENGTKVEIQFQPGIELQEKEGSE